MKKPKIHLKIVLFLVAVTGCTTANPNHRSSGDGGGVGDGGGPTCQATCSMPFPFCNSDSGACVECLPSKPEACTGKKPVCGSNFSCQACTAHSQCASNVCLPDGSCSDSGDVAFVQQGASGTTCTKADPCSLLSTAVSTKKPYVKISGMINDNVIISSQNVTILTEPNAKISGKVRGVVLKVNGNSEVSIYGLTIENAIGFPYDGHGMVVDEVATAVLREVTLSNNVGAGLYFGSSAIVNVSNSTFTQNYSGISGSGVLTLTRSIISDNRGGISIYNGKGFQITNNFIVRNKPFAGLNVDSSNPANVRIEFNTIVGNHADKVGTFSSGGVICFSQGVIAANNAVFGNTFGAATEPQTSGTCDFSQSLLTSPANPGFTSGADYHLTAETPSGLGGIRDVVTCSGVVDFDGESRPKNGRCDFGADEY